MLNNDNNGSTTISGLVEISLEDELSPGRNYQDDENVFDITRESSNYTMASEVLKPNRLEDIQVDECIEYDTLAFAEDCIVLDKEEVENAGIAKCIAMLPIEIYVPNPIKEDNICTGYYSLGFKVFEDTVEFRYYSRYLNYEKTIIKKSASRTANDIKTVVSNIQEYFERHKITIIDTRKMLRILTAIINNKDIDLTDLQD